MSTSVSATTTTAPKQDSQSILPSVFYSREAIGQEAALAGITAGFGGLAGIGFGLYRWSKLTGTNEQKALEVAKYSLYGLIVGLASALLVILIYRVFLYGRGVSRASGVTASVENLVKQRQQVVGGPATATPTSARRSQ